MNLAPGAVVDRWEVEAVLGEGATAVVYRVRHRALGSLHALKVLSCHSTQVRERLLREGRLQARLAHPNIVTVTDLVDVAGSPGLIMQYVDGPTLEAWLSDHRLTLEEAEAVFAGILDAVTHAHAAGVIHRDLKPGNVLLAPGLVPRVTDFGLAKAFHDVGGYQTLAGVALGTPAYMAPEQIRDTRTADHRADVFALGCILYELVTGRTAFAGEYITVYEAIVAGRWDPELGEVPERLRRAISGALLTSPEERWQDCAALRAAMTCDDPTAWGGWPIASAGAAGALTSATARARREGRAWISLGDLHHGLVAQGHPELAGGVLFADPRLPRPDSVEPVPTPAVRALGAELPPRFGLAALGGALAGLVARLAPPRGGAGSLTVELPPDGPLALVVLVGPEQGRRLEPAAGEVLGRYRSSGGPEHALYADRSLGVDLQVHGRHLAWHDGDAVEGLHPWRHADGALVPPLTRAVAAGERVRLAAGDEVWLSAATGMRVVVS